MYKILDITSTHYNIMYLLLYINIYTLFALSLCIYLSNQLPTFYFTPKKIFS